MLSTIGVKTCCLMDSCRMSEVKLQPTLLFRKNKAYTLTEQTMGVRVNANTLLTPRQTLDAHRVNLRPKLYFLEETKASH